MNRIPQYIVWNKCTVPLKVKVKSTYSALKDTCAKHKIKQNGACWI